LPRFARNDGIKAVLAYDDGYSYSDIARILLLDDETIRRHVEDYFSKRKLKPENGGSESHLNKLEGLELQLHLSEVTYLYVKDIPLTLQDANFAPSLRAVLRVAIQKNFNIHPNFSKKPNWIAAASTPRNDGLIRIFKCNGYICAYVNRIYNKSYSVSGMTKWLHLNNCCYKKPHSVPAKADAEKQAVFIDHYKALKNSLSKSEVIYFVDSSHPQHQTRLAYGWIKKGVRKAVKMTSCQKRVNIIGAINLDGHHIEYSQVDWVNTESIQAFLEQLIEANPRAKKIHLILDNARYHKSKEILSFVSQSNITLHYLPPYSPNLNCIERLWKILNEQITYNQYYPKFSDFVGSISNFFENIEKYKTIIKSRITDNFQSIMYTAPVS
jgi:transposase